MKFIFGEENYLIAKELSKIKKSINIDPIFYDDESLVSNIISEINTISLFNDKKFIILKNIQGLTKDSENKELLQELMNLKDTNIILVFIFEGKINKKNKLVDFLIKNYEAIECNPISERDIVSTIKEIVKSKGGKISASAAIALSGKLPNNLRIIIQETEKLLLENTVIEKDNVENSIGKYFVEDYFALPNAIISNNTHQIIKAYNDKVENREEVITILSQIASTFNLVYKVMLYKNKGLTSQIIADELKIHIFRIKKALEVLSMSPEDKIKKIIIMLSDLDKNIKNGKTDPKIGLDNLILNLIK